MGAVRFNVKLVARVLSIKRALYGVSVFVFITAFVAQSFSFLVEAATNGPLVPTPYSSIGVGQSHTCGVTAGAAYCWGSGANGRLGNNSTTQSLAPVAVDTSGVLSGKTVTAVSVGFSYTCVIAGGAAYCWGTNGNGMLGNNSVTQSFVPVAVDTSGVLSGKTVTAISAGTSHSCAIAAGAAYCWGLNTNGRLGNNSTTESLVPVAVDTSGVLSGKTATSIDAGDSHTCAIATGAAYCWGANQASGILGNNSTVESLVPVAVDTSGVLSGKTVATISAGSAYSCVVADSAAYCWGINSSGTLGNNSSTASRVPVAVNTSGALSGKTVTFISVNQAHTCAVATGAGYCWGTNTNGPLGNNSTTLSLVPVVVASRLLSPIGSASHQFFRNNNSLQPGSPISTQNQIAEVSTNNAFRLRTGVLGGQKYNTIDKRTVTEASAGFSHTCALASGVPYCWGSGLNGLLGTGVSVNSLEPAEVNISGVLSGKTVTAISAGQFHSCVIADGAAYCWGTGTNGRLGNNNGTSTFASPVAVDATGVLSGKTVTAISAGISHTCVVASGAAYCWGNGTSGQVGNNSTSNQILVPVAVDATGVLSGKTVTAISAGSSHTCAIADNAAYCWGLGTVGRLGNNSTTQSLVPVAVDTSGVLSGKTVTRISTGDTHSCAIADTAAYCWGSGANGRIGHNLATLSLVPVAVSTAGVLSGKTVTAISAGSSHTCAIAGGSAYCWGINTNGRLGNNSTTQSLVPVAVDTSGVLSGKTVTTISSVGAFSCAVAAGATYCWGFNGTGQFGNNSIAESLVPVRTATVSNGVSLVTTNNDFSLRFAEKTAVTCSAQTTGFTNVTTTSALAWNTNSNATNGSAISRNTNDPAFEIEASYQTYISSGTSFTNSQDIAPGKIGLWDFSLQDTAGVPASYCLKITYADGTNLETYDYYPEVLIEEASLQLGFIDINALPITTPSMAMAPTNVLPLCQVTTGVLGDVTNSRLRMTQQGSFSNGWTVSIAVTGGPTDSWLDDDTNERYDYNDPSGSPAGCNSGSDGDGIAGLLSVDTDTTDITPQNSCSTTGLSWNNGVQQFDQGNVDAITLLSGSSSAQSDCYWDMSGTVLSQTIPYMQPAGEYKMQLTVTAVAQ